MQASGVEQLRNSGSFSENRGKSSTQLKLLTTTAMRRRCGSRPLHWIGVCGNHIKKLIRLIKLGKISKSIGIGQGSEGFT